MFGGCQFPASIHRTAAGLRRPSRSRHAHHHLEISENRRPAGRPCGNRVQPTTYGPNPHFTIRVCPRRQLSIKRSSFYPLLVAEAIPPHLDSSVIGCFALRSRGKSMAIQCSQSRARTGFLWIQRNAMLTLQSSCFPRPIPVSRRVCPDRRGLCLVCPPRYAAWGRSCCWICLPGPKVSRYPVSMVPLLPAYGSPASPPSFRHRSHHHRTAQRGSLPPAASWYHHEAGPLPLLPSSP